MASNKFATMLHRNTHKITLFLVYAVLEWILIILLLLNSLFSYLIMKFASFFGLKTPCLWCSRIDHVLEPGKSVNSYRDLVCENHATEISKLGYCQNHRKLAEAGDMCEDCSSSRSSHIKTDSRIAFFSLGKDMGMISSDGRSKMENGEKDLKCSCCDVSLKDGFYSPYLLFKPSWDVLDYTQKSNLIKEKGEEVENCDGYSDPSKSECPTEYEKDEIINRDEEAENQMLSDVSADKTVERTEEEKVDKEYDCMESFLGFRCEEIEGGDEIGSMKTEEEAVEEHSELPLEGNVILPSSDDNEILVPTCREDSSIEILTPCLGRFSDDERLLPVALIDSMTVKYQTSMKYRVEEEPVVTKSEFLEQVVPIVDTRNVMEDEVVFFFSKREDGVLVLITDEDDSKSTKLEILAENECSSSVLAKKSNGDLVEDVSSQVAISQATQTDGDADNTEPAVKDYDETRVSGEYSEIVDTEDKPESLVEKDLSHETLMDSHQVDESVPSFEALQTEQSQDDDEDTADHRTCHELAADEDQGPEPPKELARDGGECSLASRPALQIEPIQRIGQGINHHVPSCYNEAEEEKVPETPTYIEGIHSLHKRLLFERKESGPESLDGSVISEIDGGEGLTLDRLKSALKAERRVLGALYAELEEERSASAIAANQTMAMITRLQEEKAAMQMEALQYQRMMEEQSEYDQEALQLLNELMVKREKEKQELEKELELYRKKVLQYEGKEKTRMIKKKKDEERSRISSASSSPEDSDGLSTDLNEGDDNFYGLQESTQNTPVDEVLSIGILQENTKQLITLDESLADFEGERLSILEQLKALEEKLFTLGDEGEHFEDVKAIEELTVYNGNMVCGNYEICGHEENGIPNGFSDELSTNGKHHTERRNMGPKAKRLLPLFDAIGMENENELHEDQDVAAISQNSVPKFSSDDRRIAIEEEVDHVYERLQALEADREFLKHCISSLKKGDKGMDLLQEILQHLRDLRTVELRVKNTSDALS